MNAGSLHILNLPYRSSYHISILLLSPFPVLFIISPAFLFIIQTKCFKIAPNSNQTKKPASSAARSNNTAKSTATSARKSNKKTIRFSTLLLMPDNSSVTFRMSGLLSHPIRKGISSRFRLENRGAINSRMYCIIQTL